MQKIHNAFNQCLIDLLRAAQDLGILTVAHYLSGQNWQHRSL